jgi:adenylate cyclase
MTECIFKNSGTLDKYVGDEIVAFFGAPSDEHRDDHARHAVLAALDMRDELVKLQERWKSEEKQKLEAGIGINTGEMLVGNMGSSNIFDYTVIGDEVNLGARVEELTRTHDAQIIITESTYEQVKDMVEAVEIGVEKIRGREKGIRIFEVCGRKDKTA